MAINLDKNGTQIQAYPSIGLSHFPPPLNNGAFYVAKKSMKIKGRDRLKQRGGLGDHGSCGGFSQVLSCPAASFAWPPHSFGCCRWRLNAHSTLTYLAGGYKCLLEHHWPSVEAIPGLQRTWRLMSPFRLGPSNKSAIVLRARYFSFLYPFEGFESVIISASLGTLSFN